MMNSNGYGGDERINLEPEIEDPGTVYLPDQSWLEWLRDSTMDQKYLQAI